MAMPTQKVEIGFDILDSGLGPYFILDDPTKGQLDNTEYLLAGTLFFDVTDRVKSVTIRRGKNRELDQYDQGLANVVFDNNDRAFDPEFDASPYAGQIVPKRQIRISSGDVVQFVGFVDDWNLTYETNGDSLASAACSDATSNFATQTIATRTNSVEKSGERINTILSLSDIDWPLSERDIETGQMTLGADTIPDNTNALDYLRLIERSEPGAFFIGKEGGVVFKDRNAAAVSGGLTLADDGTGIPYLGMKVQYGSELLANEVVVSSQITDYAVVALDEDSIGNYGVFNLTRSDLLIDANEDVENYAAFLANKYSEPEYRFEAVDILVDELTTAQQAQVLALEIGDVVSIKFTPNGVSPAIEKFAEVIRIDQTVDTVNHVMTLGFSTLEFALFVLDDTQFGKLDSGNALAF